VSLEDEMPKLTTAEEMKDYRAPTLIITGTDDIFFPERNISRKAAGLFGDQLELKRYKMGHFPSDEDLMKIDVDIKSFLAKHYL